LRSHLEWGACQAIGTRTVSYSGFFRDDFIHAEAAANHGRAARFTHAILNQPLQEDQTARRIIVFDFAAGRKKRSISILALWAMALA